MPPPSFPDRPRPSRPVRRKVSARVYRRRRIAAALAALLVLGLVMAAGGWGYTAFRFGQISSVHVPGLGKAPSDGWINLLVVGSDTRQGLRMGGFGQAGGQRSDVIIVVHLVPAARHAAVLSIPRDLYVPVAGTGGSAKINSAFNHGSGQLVQTIQERLGIPSTTICWSTSTVSARSSTPSAGSRCTSRARSSTTTTGATSPGSRSGARAAAA